MKLLAKELFSYIDLTTLNATDSVYSVDKLIDFALDNETQGNAVAAICVFPNFGEHVVSRLTNSKIHTAVVAGGFPHGQTFTGLKQTEVQAAAQSGVDDIDIVLNRGVFFGGDMEAAKHEIMLLKESSGQTKLKVILETGELKTDENIRSASALAISAGADFIKTSTGKCEIGATFKAARIMCQEIRREFEASGKKIGFKPSGGIRTFDDAALYRDVVLAELGEDWLTPDLFRIGASSLAGDLLKLINS